MLEVVHIQFHDGSYIFLSPLPDGQWTSSTVSKNHETLNSQVITAHQAEIMRKMSKGLAATESIILVDLGI